MPDSSILSVIVVFFIFYLLSIWLVSRGVVHQMKEVLDRTSMILRYLGTEPAGNAENSQPRSTNHNESEDTASEERTPCRVQVNLMRNRIEGTQQTTLSEEQNNPVPPDPVEEPRESHLLSFKRGLLCLHQKKYKKAIAQFSRSIEIKPDFPLVYEYRGEAYFWIGEKEKGKADLKKAKVLKGF